MAKRKNYTIVNNAMGSNVDINVNDNIQNINESDKCDVYDEKMCNVIARLSENKVVVNFDGFGIIVPVDNSEEFIKIKYTGKIGRPDFKYEVV